MPDDDPSEAFEARLAPSQLRPAQGGAPLQIGAVQHVRMDGNGNFQDLEKPMTIGAVKLDGADSLLFLPVEGVKAADLKEGLKVKIQWREETKGELADIRVSNRLARRGRRTLPLPWTVLGEYEGD